MLRHMVLVTPEQQPYPPPVDDLIQVDESDDEVGDIRGSSARTARDAEGELTVTERTLETTLQHAASRARCVYFHRAPLPFFS